MDGEYESPYCGRYIKATNIGSNDGVGGDGNVVDVLVQDTCESCGEGDVDFSLGAWNELTNNAEPGTFTVSWYGLYFLSRRVGQANISSFVGTSVQERLRARSA